MLIKKTHQTLSSLIELIEAPIHNSRFLYLSMAPTRSLAAAAVGMARARARAAVARVRGGHGGGESRWTSDGTQERPNGYLLNRTPPPTGESRKWEDWELPCYITSFLTIVILGVGLNAKPDLTIETWAHQKALERLQQQQQTVAADAE